MPAYTSRFIATFDYRTSNLSAPQQQLNARIYTMKQENRPSFLADLQDMVQAEMNNWRSIVERIEIYEDNNKFFYVNNDLEVVTNPAILNATTNLVVKTITANYTISEADTGCLLRVNSASDVTITLPAVLAEGFICMVKQIGVGKAVFSPASGATLDNYDGFTKTAGAKAVVNLLVDSNTNGVSAVWNLLGNGSV